MKILTYRLAVGISPRSDRGEIEHPELMASIINRCTDLPEIVWQDSVDCNVELASHAPDPCRAVNPRELHAADQMTSDTRRQANPLGNVPAEISREVPREITNDLFRVGKLMRTLADLPNVKLSTPPVSDRELAQGHDIEPTIGESVVMPSAASLLLPDPNPLDLVAREVIRDRLPTNRRLSLVADVLLEGERDEVATVGIRLKEPPKAQFGEVLSL